MSSIQKIIIFHIRRDGGTQARQGNNEATVEEYTAAMHEERWQWHQGNALTVFYDGTDYWLGDGFHRIESATRAGLLSVPCDVREGGRREAVLHACGANASHGLRRTREDVRRAIDILLRDPEWGQWSDREIARRVGCSHPTVASMRQEMSRLSGKNYQIAERTVSRNGTTYTQTPPARPAPVQTAVEEDDDDDEEDDAIPLQPDEEDAAEADAAEKPQPLTCTRCGKTHTWPTVFYGKICESCYYQKLGHAEDYTQIGAEAAAERGIEEHTLDVHIPLDWDTWRARALALGATLTLSRLGVALLALDGAVLYQVHNHKTWPKLCHKIAEAEAQTRAEAEPASLVAARSQVATVLAGLIDGRTESELRLLYALILARYDRHRADPEQIQDSLWAYACQIFSTEMEEEELVWIKTGDWEKVDAAVAA